MKKWICMLLILSIMGGIGDVNVNGDKGDDDGKDWWHVVECLEENNICNC